MHDECIILRFEIVVFSVMGPSNLNGHHRRFTLDLLLPSTDGLRKQTQNATSERSIAPSIARLIASSIDR
jgi:hypothetical protein